MKNTTMKNFSLWEMYDHNQQNKSENTIISHL